MSGLSVPWTARATRKPRLEAASTTDGRKCQAAPGPALCSSKPSWELLQPAPVVLLAAWQWRRQASRATPHVTTSTQAEALQKPYGRQVTACQTSLRTWSERPASGFSCRLMRNRPGKSPLVWRRWSQLRALVIGQSESFACLLVLVATDSKI